MHVAQAQGGRLGTAAAAGQVDPLDPDKHSPTLGTTSDSPDPARRAGQTRGVPALDQDGPETAVQAVSP
ncbi:hypothetical protein KRM28CT15_33350 [Krasilnikovia sp. M28-CT-15]